MQTENCKSCGAKILWLKHFQTGSKNPIDAAPSKEGNLVISRELGQYRTATENEKDIARTHNKNLYISHLATCPNSDKHRK